MFDVILHGFSHVRDDISSKQVIKQVSKKTDFTIDLIWWSLLRLAPLWTLGDDKQCIYYLFIMGMSGFRLQSVMVYWANWFAMLGMLPIVYLLEYKGQLVNVYCLSPWLEQNLRLMLQLMKQCMPCLDCDVVYALEYNFFCIGLHCNQLLFTVYCHA